MENLELPQGTNLIINVHQLHRKKEIWGENAHKFEPENFSADKINERHSYSFLPFASGSRLCIGKRLCRSLFSCYLVQTSMTQLTEKSFQEIVMR